MTETQKRFIVKILIKLLVGASIIWSIVILENSSINTLIQNQLALGQMGNSDFNYFLMQHYQQILVNVKFVIGFIFGVFITKDFVKFKKNKE